MAIFFGASGHMYQNIFINSVIMLSCSLFLFQIIWIVKVCCYVKTMKDFLTNRTLFPHDPFWPKIFPPLSCL